MPENKVVFVTGNEKKLKEVIIIIITIVLPLPLSPFSTPFFPPLFPQPTSSR